jgi:hypothetical protein
VHCSTRHGTVGFDPAGGDERVEVVTIEADVTAELGEPDAAFGDEAPDKARLGTEQVGGLLDGQ